MYVFGCGGNFYSHTPCGVQRAANAVFTFASQFLLTHPLRGATELQEKYNTDIQNFYSHTPCGVQPDFGFDISEDKISTHTPLAGCNLTSGQIGALHWHFYSHTPCGVQHIMASNCLPVQAISTHTPLAGCNARTRAPAIAIANFYSHTPCGVQPMRSTYIRFHCKFLLTHPLRGATRVQNRKRIDR